MPSPDQYRIVSDGINTKIIDASGKELPMVTSVVFRHQAGFTPVAEVTMTIINPALDAVASMQIEREYAGG